MPGYTIEYVGTMGLGEIGHKVCSFEMGTILLISLRLSSWFLPLRFRLLDLLCHKKQYCPTPHRKRSHARRDLSILSFISLPTLSPLPVCILVKALRSKLRDPDGGYISVKCAPSSSVQGTREVFSLRPAAVGRTTIYIRATQTIIERGAFSWGF